MSRKLKLKNGAEIIVEPIPFASGGEGDLHRIISPATYKNQVAKIYKPEKQTKERERKIDYLVANPPRIQVQNGHHSIIWINQVVYEAGKFAGFIMYEAKGEKLEYLCHAKLPQNLGRDWGRFDLQNSQSLDLRKKLCFNIAAAIFQIHSLGNYVMVDMKPDNIMVQPNGLISIIDVDSVEVIQSNKVLFPAPVATPEYIPPEYYNGLKPEKELIPETWDRFSLSVIFYRLLSGIHPFIGTCKPPFDTINDASGKIEKGLYPNGKNRDKFRVIPPPHQTINKLEKSIQDLFSTCFDEGHISPALRPTADDWCRVLSPQPVIKINRLLPSQKHRYESFHGSASLKFNTSFNSSYDKPKLLMLQKPKGFGAFLNRIFGGSVKQILINQIIERENEWYKLNSKAQSNIIALNNLNGQFQGAQGLILEKETKHLSKVKLQYQKDLTLIDEKAHKLFLGEQGMLQQLEQQLLSNLTNYDIIIRQYYAQHIQPIEQHYTNSFNNIQQRNAALMDQETQEIKNIETEAQRKINQIKNDIRRIEEEFISQQDDVLNTKLQEINSKRRALSISEDRALADALERYQANYIANYASQYRISDDAHSIFHDQYAEPSIIVRNLANYGIRTAADFSAVDAFGQILTNGGRWVKVPQVAAYRAERLESWRKSKMRNTPTTVPQSLPQSERDRVKQQFKIQYDRIEQEERNARNEAIQRKSNVPISIVNQKIEADKKERALIQDSETRKNQIKVNYTSQRQSLTQQYNKLQQEYHNIISKKKEPYEMEKAKVLSEQTKIRNKFEADKKQIQKSFNPLHLPLFQEAAELSAKVEFQVTSIKNGIQSELRTNYNSYTAKFEQMHIAWKELQTEISEFINSLKFLQDEYGKMSS